MERLLRACLGRFVRRGNLRVTTAGGATIALGDGTGKLLSVRFLTRAAQVGVLVDPELKFGEGYMDGSIVVEQGTMAEVLALLFSQNIAGLPTWARPQKLLRYIKRRLQQFNPRSRARLSRETTAGH